MYLGVHLTYLSGVRGRRLRVFHAWTAARFGTRESWVLEGKLPGVQPEARAAKTETGEPTSR